MKKQELHPNCPFAPSQMVADADLPGPIAQGTRQNRGVNHCEGEKKPSNGRGNAMGSKTKDC